jgi:hypothetical protein
MLTSAITALISGILSFFGISPGPYIAPIWIGVKVTLVALIALVGWRAVKRRQRLASEATPPAPPADAAPDPLDR